MEKQLELTQEVLANVTEASIGVVELSDEMLQMVAGGIPVGWTNEDSTCWRVYFHKACI